MSEQITLHYQCRLCGKQLDRGIHLGPPSPGTCSKAAKVDGFHGPHRWVIVSLVGLWCMMLLRVWES